MKETITRAENSLKMNLDWVDKHDSRTAFAAGTCVAMLGVLTNASTKVAIWHWYLYAIFGITAVLLFISLTVIYFSQYPKTKSRNQSLIFFKTVADLKCDAFTKQFKAMSDEEYLDDLLSQIHINAEILDIKFRRLKCALWFIFITILPWLTAIYLSKIYFK